MVLASHEAYTWLENQVHGVGRVTLGVQPQRPRESVPVLRSEQVTVFSGLQPGFLPDVYDTRFPCALDWRGEFRNEQTIPSPSRFYFQTPRPDCGRARAALRSCCVNALREQCPPADTVRTDLCGLPGSQGCLPVAVGLLAGPLCP